MVKYYIAHNQTAGANTTAAELAGKGILPFLPGTDATELNRVNQLVQVRGRGVGCAAGHTVRHTVLPGRPCLERARALLCPSPPNDFPPAASCVARPCLTLRPGWRHWPATRPSSSRWRRRRAAPTWQAPWRRRAARPVISSTKVRCSGGTVERGGAGRRPAGGLGTLCMCPRLLTPDLRCASLCVRALVQPTSCSTAQIWRRQPWCTARPKSTCEQGWQRVVVCYCAGRHGRPPRAGPCAHAGTRAAARPAPAAAAT